MEKDFTSNSLSVWVFYDPDGKGGSFSGLFWDKKESDTSTKIADSAKNLANSFLNSELGKTAWKLALPEKDVQLIEKVEIELNKMKNTAIYSILEKTWAISDDRVALLKRWSTSRWDSNDGRIWAESILKAFEEYKNGKLSILTYSNEKWYQVQLFSEYEKKVSQNVWGELNGSILKWLFDIYNTEGGDSKNTFQKDTWAKIW
jgi:hypothetical protein